MYQLVEFSLQNGRVDGSVSRMKVLETGTLPDLEGVLQRTMRKKGASPELTYSSDALDESGINYWYASHDTVDNAILAVIESRKGE